MNKFSQIASVSILAMMVAACSGGEEAPEADNVTETQMDDVDVIDGTISDDMVDVDAQTSGDELTEGEEASEEGDQGNGEEGSEEEAE